MKIAEALITRSDIQKRIEQLSLRLLRNAKVQEGEEPSEDPLALISELEELSASLSELITRINLTNAAVKVNGTTLTELIAKRDTMTKKISVLQNFLLTASETYIRGARNEIIIKSSVDVSEMRKKTDRMSVELREIDTLIQSANWTNDLL